MDSGVDPWIGVTVALSLGTLVVTSVTWAIMDLYNTTKMRTLNDSLNRMTNRRKEQV